MCGATAVCRSVFKQAQAFMKIRLANRIDCDENCRVKKVLLLRYNDHCSPSRARIWPITSSYLIFRLITIGHICNRYLSRPVGPPPHAIVSWRQVKPILKYSFLSHYIC
jgi:hypothetical protein